MPDLLHIKHQLTSVKYNTPNDQKKNSRNLASMSHDFEFWMVWAIERDQIISFTASVISWQLQTPQISAKSRPGYQIRTGNHTENQCENAKQSKNIRSWHAIIALKNMGQEHRSWGVMLFIKAKAWISVNPSLRNAFLQAIVEQNLLHSGNECNMSSVCEAICWY